MQSSFNSNEIRLVREKSTMRQCSYSNMQMDGCQAILSINYSWKEVWHENIKAMALVRKKPLMYGETANITSPK